MPLLAFLATTSLLLAPPVLTSDQIFEKSEAHTLKWTDKVTVVGYIGAIGTQLVIKTDGTEETYLVLAPSHASSKTRFTIELLPSAQAALRRLSIKDFKKHFQGKTLRATGKVKMSSMNLIGSPQVRFYSLSIQDLDQIEAVDEETK